MIIVIIIYYICDIQYLLIFKAYEKFNFLPCFYGIISDYYYRIV